MLTRFVAGWYSLALPPPGWPAAAEVHQALTWPLSRLCAQRHRAHRKQLAKLADVAEHVRAGSICAALTASPTTANFLPGIATRILAYNGTTPGSGD